MMIRHQKSERKGMKKAPPDLMKWLDVIYRVGRAIDFLFRFLENQG